VRSWGDGMFSEGKVAAIPEAHWTADASHYSAVYGPAGCASCGAHSVRLDPQGHIWVVDAPGHVVYELSPEGKEIRRLGTRGKSGTGPNSFNLPTDVAFGPTGDIYVTDGYGSARVVKYSRDGKFVLQWGTRGKGIAEFGLPHNLVIDREGRVYVTDRDNQRVEVFDPNGKFLTQWRGFRTRDHQGPANLDRRDPAAPRRHDRREAAWESRRPWCGGDRCRRRLHRAAHRRRAEVRQAIGRSSAPAIRFAAKSSAERRLHDPPRERRTR